MNTLYIYTYTYIFIYTNIDVYLLSWCLDGSYQDDWLKTSSSTLHLWEKAPLEPYALSKQVFVLGAVCVGLDLVVYVESVACMENC